MPRHPRYVKNKRTGDIGTIVKGDLLHVPFSGLLGGATGQDLHVESATKLYNLGTRRVTPDGRVFRYARASNIVTVRHFGLKFWGQIGDGYAGTAVLTASIGDKTFVATIAGTVKDEYAGGYVTFFTTPVQTRCILSNTVAAADNTVIFTLDQPLTTALVTDTTYTEILQSPYANVRLTAGPSGGDAGNDYSSVAGIPAVITDAVNQYLWIQTWGPIWINPHGSSLQTDGITGGERKLVFDCEGSICIVDDVAHGPCGAGGDEQQIAGFIIDRSASGTSGPPLVMLQISP
jgi:hypothetical protein